MVFLMYFYVRSWLGGNYQMLGFYKVTVFSLFSSGVFFVLQYITSFWGFIENVYNDIFSTCLDLLYISVLMLSQKTELDQADSSTFGSKLRFREAPALGGLIIMGIGYQGLRIEWTSCILAILIFCTLVMKRKHHSIDPHASVRNQIQTKDKIF
jgi:hypothetical protein